jgi:hypothetical protein
MSDFVDLSRRFRTLTNVELENPDDIAELSDIVPGASLDWPDLLEESRVLLLAEAGSGKTEEMREQAQQLVAAGKYAFFVPLESLAKEDLRSVLSSDQERAFEAWKADKLATAWFFLDAVDELKLTEGKLDRALARIEKAVDRDRDRIRVIVSSRPHDWRPEIDMRTLVSTLPIMSKPLSPGISPDEVFLRVVRRDPNRGGPARDSDKKRQEHGSQVCVVALLPMSERQIDVFARARGVRDPDAFRAELEKQHAWSFARRPLDLGELIVVWEAAGHLGTRADQHEANVRAKLRDDPDRPDKGVLTEAKAREGAERLALALALTRCLTIRSPEQASAAQRVGVLDAAQVLVDWNEAERQTLLRRALFDPATYGRVRFHHRSVPEYLAACRLRNLRDRGMTTKALLRLLFADRYGEKVVVPSLRAIAAWLALWNADVFRETAAREPELLLSHGDPESLDLESRARVLRSFASAYSQGGVRGINIPWDEVRRLAHRDLAPVVRELWNAGPTNPDVRELLLEVIWQGRIEDCADIALSAAHDRDLEIDHRATAIRAVLACGRDSERHDLGTSILGEPTLWPDELVHKVAPDLFPELLSVDELMQLIERMHEPGETTAGFSWAARQIAQNQSWQPWSERAVELRNRLAKLIWEQRNSHQDWWDVRGRFDYLAPALGHIVAQQLTREPSRCDDETIWAAVIAHRFGRDEHGSAAHARDVGASFDATSPFRARAFWTEVDVMKALVPPASASDAFFHARERGLIGELAESDRVWLERELSASSEHEKRAVALQALFDLFRRNRVSQDVIDHWASLLRDDERLTRVLDERGAMLKADVPAASTLQSRPGKTDANVADWVRWRSALFADPAAAFRVGEAERTVVTLINWLRLYAQTHRFDVWDPVVVSHVFGADVAARAAQALQALWRTQPMPPLWSRRPADQRDAIPMLWIAGLCGVSSDARSEGWADRLSHDEARTATAYAGVGFDGFPVWLKDLVASQPTAVDSMLGEEISAELQTGPEQVHLPAVEALARADPAVQNLVAPRLRACLLSWPATIGDRHVREMVRRLELVLDVVATTLGTTDCTVLAEEFDSRVRRDPASELSVPWLRGLLQLAPERGVDALTVVLASGLDATRAERLFAELFEPDRGRHSRCLPEIADPALRASVLGRLVRLAYAYVRSDDDQQHEGVYTPNDRDSAQSARNWLISALLNAPGPETQQVVLELVTEPSFAGFSDRLRLLARERAAHDAEFESWTPAQIVACDSSFELQPNDRHGMFAVMIDRLDDLTYDVRHHDFTDRETLRAITKESAMQRTLALRLELIARGSYRVTREEQVADDNRTDIRLLSVSGNHKAVSEVKLADKWTVRELVEALKVQLVGKYMRHDTCKAGCLLLTYNGTRAPWRHPDSGAQMCFAELVRYLNDIAAETEKNLGYSVRLGVVGIDLTVPSLGSAS